MIHEGTDRYQFRGGCALVRRRSQGLPRPPSRTLSTQVNRLRRRREFDGPLPAILTRWRRCTRQRAFARSGAAPRRIDGAPPSRMGHLGMASCAARRCTDTASRSRFRWRRDAWPHHQCIGEPVDEAGPRQDALRRAIPSRRRSIPYQSTEAQILQTWPSRSWMLLAPLPKSGNIGLFLWRRRRPDLCSDHGVVNNVAKAHLDIRYSRRRRAHREGNDLYHERSVQGPHRSHKNTARPNVLTCAWSMAMN